MRQDSDLYAEEHKDDHLKTPETIEDLMKADAENGKDTTVKKDDADNGEGKK